MMRGCVIVPFIIRGTFFITVDGYYIADENDALNYLEQLDYNSLIKIADDLELKIDAKNIERLGRED